MKNLFKSEKLTESAKNIFGSDIVKAVFIDIEDLEVEEINAIEKNTTSNTISSDANSIIIEFNNGKVIEFWNSEWGGIRKKIL